MNLEDAYKSDDNINIDEPEIDEPDMAEEDYKAEVPKNDPAPTSSKKRVSATNRNNSNELKKLTKAVSLFCFIFLDCIVMIACFYSWNL